MGLKVATCRGTERGQGCVVDVSGLCKDQVPRSLASLRSPNSDDCRVTKRNAENPDVEEVVRFSIDY